MVGDLILGSVSYLILSIPVKGLIIVVFWVIGIIW